METATIYKSDYEKVSEYRAEYQRMSKSFDCKVKVQDGKGGFGWMFFESAEDMRIWKNQK